jgi:hypothetical protein
MKFLFPNVLLAFLLSGFAVAPYPASLTRVASAGVPAQQDTPPTANGSGWNGLSQEMQLGFVIGFDAGIARGSSLAAGVKSLDGKGSPIAEKARDKMWLRGLQRLPQPLTTFSYGQRLGEVTLFYKDFRNTPVCWGDAVSIAEFTLYGIAPSEAELDAVRAEDAKEDCR